MQKQESISGGDNMKTEHEKFLMFINTVENKETEVLIESVPAEQHWIVVIEINGEEAKLLQLNDNYIFVFDGEAQVLNVKQYNVLAESFMKVVNFVKANT